MSRVARVGLGLAFAALLGGAGCLILGSVNHRPTIALELPSGPFVRGQTITLAATVADEDEDEADALTIDWVVQFRSGQTVLWLAADGSLSVEPVERSGEGGSLLLTLPAGGEAASGASAGAAPADVKRLGGSYTVSVVARARDPRRAVASASAQLTVQNQLPTPRIVLTDYAGQQAPAQLPRHLGHWVTAATTSDADDDPGKPSDELACGAGQVTTRWEAVDPPQSAYLQWDVTPCTGTTVLDKLLWRLPPSSSATRVTLRLTVTDRWGGEASVERSFDVAPDGTPCITSADPKVPTVTFPTSVPSKIAVVVDDVDDVLAVASATIVSAGAVETAVDALTTLRYRWLSADSAAGPWKALAGQAGSRLVLDDLLPGERRFYRVITAADRTGLDAVACAPGVAFCQHAAGLPPGCHQWISWEVEAK
jgi:hypothetical protein